MKTMNKPTRASQLCGLTKRKITRIGISLTLAWPERSGIVCNASKAGEYALRRYLLRARAVATTRHEP